MAKIIRLPEVKAQTGLCRTAIYAAIQAGTFPQQIPLGTPRAVGWDSDEVQVWIDKTIKAGKKLRAASC
jgi:prophage regulatory protein